MDNMCVWIRRDEDGAITGATVQTRGTKKNTAEKMSEEAIKSNTRIRIKSVEKRGD